MASLPGKDEGDGGAVTIPEPIIVVEGTVMRITRAGNLIMYPDQRGTEAHEGSRVLVLNSIGNRVPVSLEVIRESVNAPYVSDLTLVVGARKRLEMCNAWCGDRKLFAADAVGTAQSELPLPVGGYLYFRIPRGIVDDNTMVEIRNGTATLRRERFANIVGATEAAPRRQNRSTA